MKKNIKVIIVTLLTFIFYQLYFLLFISNEQLLYLIYVDFLYLVIFGSFFIYDFIKDRKKQRFIFEQLQIPDLIYQEFEPHEYSEIILHDINILEDKLEEQFQMNCDLQDYITKWCHEIKIPLAALFLMCENIEDKKQKETIKDLLEKMKQQVNTVMTGCRVQTNIYDLQIKKIDLADCIRTSIKNNQFFLIQKHFEIDMNVTDVYVYSDSQWLVYIFDQVVYNAIKYHKESPQLKIWSETQNDSITLYVEDNGTGIKEEDLKYLFDKGFTGSNHHNGQYKSTGMGLYLVSTIAKKLGHDISIESEFGQYTRFIIRFFDNRDFFHL